MPRYDMPPQWKGPVEAAGLHSYRDVAAAAGVASHETIRRLFTGHNVKMATVVAVARALRIEPEQVLELSGAGGDVEPWEPPDAAARLTRVEREALAALINAITQGRDQAGAEGQGPGLPGDEPPAGAPAAPAGSGAPRGPRVGAARHGRPRTTGSVPRASR